MIFTNKVYDVLKWVAQLLLPALGTLYFVLAGIWNFPYGEQVVGTIMALDAFLGILLGVSSTQYNNTANDLPYKASIVTDADLKAEADRQYKADLQKQEDKALKKNA